MGTRTLARGLAAGVAGTAAMTVYRRLLSHPHEGVEPTWETAPPQARIARGVLRRVGVDLSPRRIPLVSNVVHWAYGTALGPAYAVLDEQTKGNAALEGAGFGAGVWALSHAELTPVGLKPAPWHRRLGGLARDVSQHVVYGLVVAGVYETLERREQRSRARRALGAAVAAGGAVGSIVRRSGKDRMPSFVRAPRETARRIVPVG